jgi:hypothetical protein
VQLKKLYMKQVLFNYEASDKLLPETMFFYQSILKQCFSDLVLEKWKFVPAAGDEN